MFLYVFFLIFIATNYQATFYSLLTVTIMVTVHYPVNVFLIFPITSPPSCSWSSIGSQDALFQILSEGNKRRACGIVFRKSTVVYNIILDLSIHSLTHPEQLSILHALFMVNALKRYDFLFLILYFRVSFLCLNIHKYLPLQNCIQYLVQSHTVKVCGQVCSSLCHLSLCRCSL